MSSPAKSARSGLYFEQSSLVVNRPLIGVATGTLDEEAANEMLANMQLAAPREAALVELLTGWAKRGRQPSPEPQVSDHRASLTVCFLQSKHCSGSTAFSSFLSPLCACHAYEGPTVRGMVCFQNHLSQP